jgi:CheY-like chemotaxis protein
LPVASAAVARPRPAAARPVHAYRGGTVLLVDDEELVRTGTCHLLEELGYTVIEAGSGAEALVVIRERSTEIDALVTDFLMPGMNGATLAQEARVLVPELPVLLITGYSNIAEGPGADLPRLNKPFRQAELASKVAGLMASRQRQMSAAS